MVATHNELVPEAKEFALLARDAFDDAASAIARVEERIDAEIPRQAIADSRNALERDIAQSKSRIGGVQENVQFAKSMLKLNDAINAFLLLDALPLKRACERMSDSVINGELDTTDVSDAQKARAHVDGDINDITAEMTRLHAIADEIDKERLMIPRVFYALIDPYLRNRLTRLIEEHDDAYDDGLRAYDELARLMD